MLHLLGCSFQAGRAKRKNPSLSAELKVQEEEK